MGLFSGFNNFMHNVGHSLSSAAHTVGHHLSSAGKTLAPAVNTVLDNAGSISGVASGIGTTLLFGAPSPVGKSIGVGLLATSAVLGGIAAIRKGGKPEEGVKQVATTVKTGAETKAMLKEAYK